MKYNDCYHYFISLYPGFMKDNECFTILSYHILLIIMKYINNLKHFWPILGQRKTSLVIYGPKNLQCIKLNFYFTTVSVINVSFYCYETTISFVFIKKYN